MATKENEIVIMPNHTISTATRGARRQLFLESSGDDEGFALNSESKSSLAQRWDVVATEDFPDVVRVMNRKTKTFLTLTENDISKTFLSNSEPSDKGQQWHLRRNNRGNYSFMSRFLKDDFDIDANFAANDNDEWKLSPSQELETVRSSLENNWKKLSPQNAPLLLYAVFLGGTAAGTDLVQWGDEYGLAGSFKFEAVDEAILEDEEESWHGYYKVVTHTTKSLVLTASSDLKIKQEVEMSENGRDTQLWRLERLKDSNYLIINKSTSQVIESNQTGTTEGNHKSPVLKDYNYVSSNTNPASGRKIKIEDSLNQS